MGMMSEFKDFVSKGNVLDLAVGVIIGAAFGKIVDSMVNHLIMPIVGAIFGGLDFSNYFIKLGKVPAGTSETFEALTKAGVPVFGYGAFLTVLVNFLILAFIIFQIVKAANRSKKAAPPAPPAAPAPSEIYLKEIRDALAKR
jgi:large conductance mechanosensitive channel